MTIGIIIFPEYAYFYLEQILYYGYSFDTTALGNIQSEMLKPFSTDIPEKELIEIKDIIARYLLNKARDKADAIWDGKDYTNEKLEQMLNKK